MKSIGNFRDDAFCRGTHRRSARQFWVKLRKIRYLVGISGIFGLSLALPGLAAELAPFTSDGCSAFPEGTPAQKQLWLKCCAVHDFAYWQGGTYAQRERADEALRACVEEVGEPEIALLMLAGVRVGGSPFLPTQFRWGYGWPYPRPYGALSEEEQNAVREAILEAEKQIQSYID